MCVCVRESNFDHILCRRGYEMLLRKLLVYRQHPAIIALHSWSPFFNHPNFFSTAEDPVQSIVAYYGLQSVSMRNALFHPTWQRRQNFKGSQWLCDTIHPNTLGHRSAPFIMYIQIYMLQIVIPHVYQTYPVHSLSFGLLPQEASVMFAKQHKCFFSAHKLNIAHRTRSMAKGHCCQWRASMLACLLPSFLHQSINASVCPCAHCPTHPPLPAHSVAPSVFPTLSRSFTHPPTHPPTHSLTRSCAFP